MEYNVNSFCVFFMVESPNGVEPLGAFKYTSMPELPIKGQEFRIVKNQKSNSFKIAEFLGQAYSLEANNSCMQSFTYLVTLIHEN
ncbi:MAG: hypothetical protein IPM51_06635 [Sphingobacteriaceae bacterium]|nr:hypothetical protein [Sphingobacteriaceae bacterium]